jgi:hypothetical protein
MSSSTSSSSRPLPRDLDVSPLRGHVLTHTPSDLSVPLRYFPLPVLVHVCEAAGSHQPKRAEVVRATADMLRFRVTPPKSGGPAQLPIPLEHLLKPLASTWVPPLAPGQPHPPQPADTEYVSHRGFLEAITFWLHSRGLLGPDGRPLPSPTKIDPFSRLKSFYEYKDLVNNACALMFALMPQDFLLPPSDSS